MRKSAGNKKKSTAFTLITLLLLILCGAGAYVFLVYFEGEQPQIKLARELEYFARNNTVKFSASDQKSGLKRLVVTLSQGGKSKVLLDETVPRRVQGEPPQSAKNFELDIKPKQLGFKEGEAALIIEAEDHSFRSFPSGNKTTLTSQVVIDTEAPKINILHGERYINPGGSGIFIYQINGEPVELGLELNGRVNPGFPTGDNHVYISYFGLPFNSKNFPPAFIFARDKAGNIGRTPVSSTFKAVNFKHDQIRVPDSFLSRKVPEFRQYYPELTGSLLEQYLQINNEIRKKNNNDISAVCQKTMPERLWKGAFLRMPGKPMAGFADHRTYLHNGKKIDKQVHLGQDIASTKHAPVKAANHGKVVYADYLGIYGNMIMLDHGQGVFSLYSHLSQINVALGDMVEQGFVIGQTGLTGMAGGDHLHFSMLVNGVFVTPKEWLDKNWVTVTIEEPLIDSRFQ
ncbi:MAG: peptidase M23 [Deltaproteobacteria bacterium]|nr:MAG: peptidase M23 [Deltaproteobacteria bacterium]